MVSARASDSCPVGLRGIVPSLNTPFTPEGDVDVPSLARLVETTVTAGCGGMLVNAVAGETAALTPDEKALVLETVMASTEGRIPVIAGVSSDDHETRLELAHMAKGAGTEWMLCQPPPGLRGAKLHDMLAGLCEVGPPNLMVQDLDFTGPGMPLEAIVELFETLPNFRALKIETLPAGPKYTAVLEATAGRLHVSGGWAVQQMMEALRRGVHAFIPSTMERLYCRIHSDFMNGFEDRAQMRFDALLPVLAFAHSHIHVALRFFKLLRVAEGIFTSAAVRPPVPPLDPFQTAEAERLIALVLAQRATLDA